MLNTEKEKCCGCGACEQACPRHCIVMSYNHEGFLYPRIDKSKCADCHLCEKSCPVFQNKRSEYETKTYAAYNKDNDIRMSSSSGGVFSQLAKEVIAQEGVVFGAVFDSDWTVHHVEAVTLADLSKMRGSKYLQSRTEDTYSRVKHYLLENRVVLYTGTPCEIEGLRAFLGKDYDHLYLQDIICHGTPSPKLWWEYVSYREKCANAAVEEISFRSKKRRDKAYYVSFSFDNKTKYEQAARKDAFTQMFLQNLCLRPSCYHCSFKKLNRESDITLGDFWGCNEICPDMANKNGCSLVAVHSPKGEALLDAVKDTLVIKEVEIKQALAYNPSMLHSAPRPICRDEFMSELETSSIDLLKKKYLKRETIKSRLAALLPEKTKEQIKSRLLRRE